ncbi:MAG: Asp-tRNA(Asn)/Glu-tRNA(Gln) amidotransferase subunit GatB [Patescibacteria group bacterium]|nr:Asp-tRNA(Asn)/Glu-tRNA(Gln) amidotransferase subunit GatB [Patescibacteria group bacterium]
MAKNLQPIIGLEIHVQLKTKSKMFCGCDNRGEDLPPNTTVCPICMGHPGTLPVANRQAIEWTVKSGLALHCQIPPHSKFDRKNYFYPDLPKGYQISQYDQPIALNGYLEILDENGVQKRVNLTRIHLEEDAAKNFHAVDGRHTLVDYNRAGTPLMEIVTEPDIRTPQQAKIFMQELRLIMLYLGVSDADMEKGHMRCDANINLWELDARGEKVAASPIVEVKNMNSFRALERALAYEVKRQQEEYEQTGKLAGGSKSTRGWNDARGVTEEQRTKEEAHDYRYFPEPDLPPLDFTPGAENGYDLAALKREIPELPISRRQRFIHEYSITAVDAKILTEELALADFFERTMSELAGWVNALPDHPEAQEQQEVKKMTKVVSNWLLNRYAALLKADRKTIADGRITPENFAEFITILSHGKINSTIAQQVLEIMHQTGGDPSDIIESGGLDKGAAGNALAPLIEKVISENTEAVENYRKGKTAAAMFLVGQVMKLAKGKADPEEVKANIINRLK